MPDPRPPEDWAVGAATIFLALLFLGCLLYTSLVPA